MKKNRLMKIASVVGLSISLVLIPGVRQHAGAAEPIKIGAVMSVTGFAGNFGTNSKLAITYLSEERIRKGELPVGRSRCYLRTTRVSRRTARRGDKAHP